MLPSRAFVTVVGHAGRDIEVKYSQGGTAIASFSVATDKWRGEGRDEATTWWNISVFGRKAENANSYGLFKGDLVFVQGEVYQDEWEGQDGVKRQSLKVDASEVIVLKRAADRDDAPADTGPLVDTYVPF